MKSQRLAKQLTRRCLIASIQFIKPQILTTRRWKSHDDKESYSDWIPPEQPLAGDRGQSHLYRQEEEMSEEDELTRIEAELERMEKEEKEAKTASSPSANSVNWLKTRETMLQPTALVSPSEGALRRQSIADVEVKMHTLLTKSEIATIVKRLGGYDMKVIYDDPKTRRMGGQMGIIVVSGSGNFQIRSIAEALVRQLRRRKLQGYGVVGAELGYEGADDPREGWYVVDCRNFVVHLQDEETRETIDLEGHWARVLRGRTSNDIMDESDIDDWAASNPVPRDFGLAESDFEHKLRALKRSRFTAPPKPRRARPQRKRR